MLFVRSFIDNSRVLRQVQTSAPQCSSSPRCFKTGHLLRHVSSRVLTFSFPLQLYESFGYLLKSTNLFFCNYYEPLIFSKLVVPANKNKFFIEAKIEKKQNKKTTSDTELKTKHLIVSLDTKISKSTE